MCISMVPCNLKDSPDGQTEHIIRLTQVACHPIIEPVKDLPGLASAGRLLCIRLTDDILL